MENLPMKPTGFNALSPQQQEAHRAKIGVRAEAILSQFWRDDKTPDAMRALEIEGWMDVLENCSHTEIREAWRDYQKTGPRSDKGRLYKPDAGALYQIILRKRPKPTPVINAGGLKDMRPVEERCSPEAAQEIMERAGFAPKKMPGA